MPVNTCDFCDNTCSESRALLRAEKHILPVFGVFCSRFGVNFHIMSLIKYKISKKRCSESYHLLKGSNEILPSFYKFSSGLGNHNTAQEKFIQPH